MPDLDSMDFRDKLLYLREEACSQSRPYHDRITREWLIYENRGYEAYGQVNRVGGFEAEVSRSMAPKITEAINRMIPIYRSQMPGIEVVADEWSGVWDDVEYVSILKEWAAMMDEVGGESETLGLLTKSNLVTGNALSKVAWNKDYQIAWAPFIDPRTFAPYPVTCRSDLMDAQYVVHTVRHDMNMKKFDYPKEVEHKKDWEGSKCVRVDEIWIRRRFAEDWGMDVSDEPECPMFMAKLVNDEVYEFGPTPFRYYPSFPFFAWRGFSGTCNDLFTTPFWGYGYASLFWETQKLIDDVLNSLVEHSRNLATGQFFMKYGALDPQAQIKRRGQGIMLNEGFGMDSIMPVPVSGIDPVIMQLLSVGMQESGVQMPSLNPVVGGEPPYPGSSGRAINSLQFAAYNQFSSEIAEMNAFRLRRERGKMEVMRQFAHRIEQPHLWRLGVDIWDDFPQEARRVSYKLMLPEEGALPNTPQGRYQLLLEIHQLGYTFKDPGIALKLLGIKNYGIVGEDLEQVSVSGPGGANYAPRQENYERDRG